MQQELRVLVIAPNLGSDLGWLRDVDARLEVDDGNALARDIDGGVAALKRAEVILLGYPVPRGIVGRAPHLRWVQHTQAGFTCGLHEATRQKAAGEFSRSGYALRTLTGATMGIVGLGGIGAEVARLARAAGMRVVATRGSVTSPQRDAEGVDLLLPADRVAELAAASDFVAVCVPLTPATERMIGAEVFAAMRPHAVLINIARGEVVDEDALIAALGADLIAGAVLDVYAGELAGRPPRRELVEFPQVVLTPHISGMGDASGHEPAKRLFAENLRRYLDGQPLLNVVDRARGY